MSDKKIEFGEVYDLTKNVKNLEINTGFILGLERIILFMITKHFEDKAAVPVMFEKFNKLLTTDNPEEIRFDEIEAHVYTLYALQQLLRSAAFEQNLVEKSPVNIDESKVESMLKAYLENDSAKITELYEELRNQFSSQV